MVLLMQLLAALITFSQNLIVRLRRSVNLVLALNLLFMPRHWLKTILPRQLLMMPPLGFAHGDLKITVVKALAQHDYVMA